MKAEDLMDEPDFIEPDAAIEEVVEEFKGSENTLIVREENKIMGEIHENSLLKAMIPEDKLDEESIVGILGISFDESYIPDDAGDLMNKHEVTVKPDTDIGEIAFLMDREDIRSLPVKESSDIIGVVHENRVIENFSEGGE